jgi:hypothetical protein
MKMIDFSLLPVTYILGTFSDFLKTHFTIKGHKGWILRKMPDVTIKTRHND